MDASGETCSLESGRGGRSLRRAFPSPAGGGEEAGRLFQGSSLSFKAYLARRATLLQTRGHRHLHLLAPRILSAAFETQIPLRCSIPGQVEWAEPKELELAAGFPLRRPRGRARETSGPIRHGGFIRYHMPSVSLAAVRPSADVGAHCCPLPRHELQRRSRRVLAAPGPRLSELSFELGRLRRLG